MKNKKNISNSQILDKKELEISEEIEEKLDAPNEIMIFTLGKILNNLYYMSETDALIGFEFTNKTEIEETKKEILKSYNKRDLIELNWEDFFVNKIEPQNWHDDFMKEITQKMIEFKNYLSVNFKTIEFLKIGKIEFDAILIAQKENKEIVLFKTKIVET